MSKINIETILKAWNSTKGYKTVTATVLWLVLRLIDWTFPNALGEGTESVILQVITAIGTLGIGDKLWRWIKEKFKKKE